MPAQTTKSGWVRFPDGCKALAKTADDADFVDLGIIDGDVNIALNFDAVQYKPANAAPLNTRIRNQVLDMSFNLIQYDPENIERLGGGAFTRVATTASANTGVPDQVIAAGWVTNTVYPLVLETSSSDDTLLKASAAPTFTAVTLDLGGTPEVLVADSEYFIVEDSSAVSGYGIMFNSSAMSTGSPTTFAITINYNSVTPVARQTLHFGSTSNILEFVQMRFVHTDSAGLEVGLDVYASAASSGGLAFNFLSSQSDGVELLPVTMQGQIDDSLTDGRQLFSWWYDTGAV